VALARGSAPPRPLLVELVGPPGVGKTTIFHGLLRSDASIEPRPVIRARAHAGLIAWNLVGSLFMIVRHGLVGRPGWQQLRELTYVQALPRILEKRHPDRIVVFDQGPIFLLTRPELYARRLTAWWRSMFARWGSLLDVVVWLEAPDAVLIERINSRSHHHRLKGARTETAVASFADSRVVFHAVLEQLDVRGSGTMILRFDTGIQSPDEVVEAILAALATRRDRDPRRAPGLP
jgi:broad-specificity NMP kinase